MQKRIYNIHRTLDYSFHCTVQNKKLFCNNIVKMYKFHNSIKKRYLDKYATVKGTRLLDLASGRGGDLSKWKKNKYINYVRGYDINEDSVKEAKKRLKYIGMPKSKSVSFKVADLTKISVKCIVPFDLITSYFAFHYFFKNKSSLDTVLKSINRCSKKGTKFILTLFDGNLINSLPAQFATESWSISKDKKVSSKGDFGNGISVYLKNSILNTPEIEYIVTPEFLVKSLANINFKIVETKAFYEFNNKNREDLSPDLKMFSDLNRIYVFEKQ